MKYVPSSLIAFEWQGYSVGWIRNEEPIRDRQTNLENFIKLLDVKDIVFYCSFFEIFVKKRLKN